MVKLLLQVIGWTLAHSPEFLVRFAAWFLGALIYALLGSRRRLIHSNLHHAFPEKSPAWRRGIARECMRRAVETGLYSFAAPFMSDARIRRIVHPGPDLQAFFDAHHIGIKPVVMGSPHMAHWETQTVLSLLVECPFPEFASIYRPVDNPAADAFIKQARERFGMKLHARTRGFQEILRVLRRRGMAGVLFDQNAGDQGALTLLFDRVCSTTELPGLLATRCDAELWVVYPLYRSFWNVELHVKKIAHDGSIEGVTVALNRWLEALLRSDDNYCASWLWGHNRWKNQNNPERRLRLENKRNYLDAELRLRGLSELPRRTRIWIRLPNWLGDVVMALPLLRALRASRPDAEITLLAKPQFMPLLEKLGVADKLRPLPKRGWGYFSHFRKLSEEFPDTYLLFTNSTRGDLEAWMTGCRQRFGIVRPGKRRSLLTHSYAPPAGFNESQHHQFKLWTDFLARFGLNTTPDLSPFQLSTPNPQLSTSPAIGLICGSENNPEKRWPVSHWRGLIEALPGQKFVLLGTANDRAITDEVAAGFGDRVENIAGKTNLVEYVDRLRSCRLLVTNDTGGMHLANMLGVPLIVLFGPTNPVRTGPIFNSPTTILQPPGCAPTGGGSLAALAVETVAATVKAQLA